MFSATTTGGSGLGAALISAAPADLVGVVAPSARMSRAGTLELPLNASGMDMVVSPWCCWPGRPLGGLAFLAGMVAAASGYRHLLDRESGRLGRICEASVH